MEISVPIEIQQETYEELGEEKDNIDFSVIGLQKKEEKDYTHEITFNSFFLDGIIDIDKYDFITQSPDYEDENVSSVWKMEEGTLKRINIKINLKQIKKLKKL